MRIWEFRESEESGESENLRIWESGLFGHCENWEEQDEPSALTCRVQWGWRICWITCQFLALILLYRSSYWISWKYLRSQLVTYFTPLPNTNTFENYKHFPTLPFFCNNGRSDHSSFMFVRVGYIYCVFQSVFKHILYNYMYIFIPPHKC